MPYTPEQLAAQTKTFGCTIPAMQEGLIKHDIMKDPLMMSMSILSDAQEEIARGHVETGRQFINRAKWLITEVMRHNRTQGIEVTLTTDQESQAA